MAVPSDNSIEESFSSLSGHTGEGVVIDIGTGDGRYVSTSARADPRKFFIGIDANVKPLEKPSMKATRKAAKGGLPNVMFVQAAIEDLPDELNGVADEIHVHFPWGSLLQAVVKGEERALCALRRIAAPECLLEIVVGIDPERDKSEMERLGLPNIAPLALLAHLPRKYEAIGFTPLECRILNTDESSRIETSWARRLQFSSTRQVAYLVFRAK